MPVDHLVYATPDLGLGIDRVERLLGIRATPGGQHPGAGTRNALIALGPTAYLEIVGPDLEQPEPGQPRWFRIDELDEPRLVTWAAKSDAIDRIRNEAQRLGIGLGDTVAGSRRRNDGVLLVWRYTNPRAIPLTESFPSSLIGARRLIHQATQRLARRCSIYAPSILSQSPLETSPGTSDSTYPSTRARNPR